MTNKIEETTLLAIKRTYLSNERTYLAFIRTTSIFAGLSILVLKNANEPKNIKNIVKWIVFLILLVCIIANFISIYLYKNYKVFGKDEYKDNLFAIAYGIILNIILMLLMITVYYS